MVRSLDNGGASNMAKASSIKSSRLLQQGVKGVYAAPPGAFREPQQNRPRLGCLTMDSNDLPSFTITAAVGEHQEGEKMIFIG